MLPSSRMRTLLICVCMTILYNSISGDCNKAAVRNALIRDNNLAEEEEVVIYLVLIYQARFFNKIGVNNGMAGNNLPTPEQAVALMQNNNIGKLRIFDAQPDTLKAYTNSGIEIIVSVTNDELQNISSSQEVADKWVKDNIQAYYPATNIKYISLGEQALETPEYGTYVLSALNNIQLAIEKANLQDKIRVSATNGRAVIPASFFPSKGAFSDSVKDRMRSFLQFLEDHGSPYMANVYPFFGYLENTSISLDYALFKSTAPTVRDEGRIYSNLFDALVDTIYSAMEALGFTDIPIVVTGSGWPSDGTGDNAHVATMENAQTYSNNLIKHVLSNAGTPKRPGKSMEVFIFALFNENLKTGDETERHFGLFYPNKTLVYPVNFYP
ncbi:hypothetical protein SUGI_1502020 [Cryptomeria japonica]|uniref:glucan endo-1,3-beta-D-glucosidase n=1 Tax=Cryptomeria japonica TaxID=3369 RepID=A0AAD3RQ14_CRYJA|nr:glucan endo-1,3-beta-glucosidase [Cryptomeria japonica]XP_057859794.1 glucan endo-1,3-beta-glucosidase [Cryptomeria japonica]XP_057859819.1 glucan endo-1,3-beta-glucosidase [Cryptomeria japonica]GLJ59302.1 hypothetical protein SUGI_1502020 [Cryptomeria japonica]